MAYTIKPDDSKYLEVCFDGDERPKRVPTAGSLTVPWLIRYNKIAEIRDEDKRNAATFEYFYELFRQYLGNKVDLLTSDQFNELIEAWGGETEEQEGVTPGE